MTRTHGDALRSDGSAVAPRVRAWQFDVGQVLAGAADLESYLSDGERERCARFRQPADRARFLACRVVLRALLGEELGLTPTAVVIENDRRGKPRLASHQDQPGLDFSVSHSGDCGCVAMIRGGRVGVDVEWLGRPLRLASLVGKTLSPRERDRYLAAPPAVQLQVFLRHWVLKEAIAKAAGLGLQVPLDQIEVDPAHPERPLTLPPSIDGGECHLRPLAMAEGYCAAVAAVVDRRPEWEFHGGSAVAGLVGQVASS